MSRVSVAGPDASFVTAQPAADHSEATDVPAKVHLIQVPGAWARGRVGVADD